MVRPGALPSLPERGGIQVGPVKIKWPRPPRLASPHPPPRPLTLPAPRSSQIGSGAGISGSRGGERSDLETGSYPGSQCLTLAESEGDGTRDPDPSTGDPAALRF